MALVKTLSPAGWDWPTSVASTIKTVDGRFGANDRRDFVKRAGDAGTHLFEAAMSQVKFAKDEIPVHLIALGAKEAWGANRNGDAFTEAMLKASHDTFVKNAFWFRNHKNKPHEGHPKYGVVKASVYNPVMRRVELLCGLPSTKEAAALLGTEVADKECEKLARDEDIAVSMACRVPYDICSGCHNKARTRDEYCKAATCKYGGCHDNLTKLVKLAGDVHHLHVENPYPVFFDISNVWRPADRTAYAGRADWVKAASDGYFGIGGCDTAADIGVSAPTSIAAKQDIAAASTPELAEQIKLAYGLAELDDYPSVWGPSIVRAIFSEAMQPELPLASLGLLDSRTEKVAEAIGALTSRKVLIPLRDFAKMTKRAELYGNALSRMRGVYYRMSEDGSLETRLASNRFVPSEKIASLSCRNAVECVVPTHSLDSSVVSNRTQLATLRNVVVPEIAYNVKQAAMSADATASEILARDYACYKVAALHKIAAFDNEFVLTTRLATCQNHVI